VRVAVAKDHRICRSPTVDDHGPGEPCPFGQRQPPHWPVTKPLYVDDGTNTLNLLHH
jgi:hypothetical protein